MTASPRIVPLLVVLTAALLRPASAPAEELGRLFFTPAERAALDHRRNRARAGVRREVPTLTVNGRVQRSSGLATVWINGVADHRRGAAEGEAGEVLVEQGGGHVRLKVGQTLDPARGEIRDGVAPGAIRIR